MDYADLTIETVAGGSVPERFEAELEKVIENVMDPNTKPDAQRRIRIDVKIKPTEDRSNGTVSVEVSSKLAGQKSDAGPFYIGRQDGKLTAVTTDPEQGDIFDDPDEDGQVSPIESARTADNGGN